MSSTSPTLRDLLLRSDFARANPARAEELLTAAEKRAAPTRENSNAKRALEAA